LSRRGGQSSFAELQFALASVHLGETDLLRPASGEATRRVSNAIDSFGPSFGFDADAEPGAEIGDFSLHFEQALRAFPAHLEVTPRNSSPRRFTGRPAAA